MNKKHIHWLLPGSFNDIQTVKNHILASIRLRTYVSTLNSKNFTFTFGENMPIETDVLVIGKIGNFDLKKKFKLVQSNKIGQYIKMQSDFGLY